MFFVLGAAFLKVGCAPAPFRKIRLQSSKATAFVKSTAFVL
jgi:hypothetical protein